MGLNICFFFPYKEVSGVPLLFYRMANKLASDDSSNRISVIDYCDGVMAKNILDLPNLFLIPFEDGYALKPPVDSILVMQSILPYAMRPELIIESSTRILFWNLHPNNLRPQILPLLKLERFFHRKYWMYSYILKCLYSRKISNINNFVDTTIVKNGILFMDKPNLDSTLRHLLRKELEVVYLPVPVPAGMELKVHSEHLDKHINFTWIGRLCDFKFYILVYTVKKLSALALEKNIDIKFKIVGDGPFRSKIEVLDVNNDKFTLELLGSVNPKCLDHFLLANTDVLVAMGTSALEGAKLGIPTILLDMSYFELTGDYKFRWLYETKAFDLGHEITHLDFHKGNRTLELMVDDIVKSYKVLSDKTLRYFEANHHIDSVIFKFKNIVMKSNLIFSDIDNNVRKKGFIRSCYEALKYGKIKKLSNT